MEESLAKRLALIILAATSPLLLACWFLSGPVAAGIAALVAVIQPVALMALGVCRKGSLGPLRLFVPLTLLWYVAVMLSLLVLDGSGITLTGIPVTAILMLAGLWLAPMVFVTIAYTKTFSQFTLTDEDLDRIRRRRPGTGPDTAAR